MWATSGIRNIIFSFAMNLNNCTLHHMKLCLKTTYL